MIGASIGAIGTVRGQYHLRQVRCNVNMHVMKAPEVMIGNLLQRFDEHGNLTDENTEELIRKLLGNLVERTRRLETRKQAGA